ncbi:MAG TPA: hypothetical protein VGI40_02270 [Pirellulaceae bacterium]
MSRLSLNLIVAALLAMFSPLSVVGEDSSWKMPNLNPFASKPTTSSRARSAPTSGWHMPKLWQTTTRPARPKIKPTNQPSTWSQMSKGTQQLLSKTADTLTPWDNKKAAPPPKITGSNSIFTQQSKPADKKSTTKDSSGIAPASWWSSEKDKSDAPKSVNEFLSQPRPR